MATLTGSDTTPEYVAFRKCYPELISAVSAQADTFCNALFAKGYISESVRNFTRNRAFLDDEKAGKLLDTVIDRIKLNPSVFHGFLEILKAPSTDDIAETLQHHFDIECELLKRCSQAQKEKEESSGDKSFHSFTDNDSSGFLCPYCGKCTVEQFFSEEGCPNKKPSPLFPNLDMSKLSESQRASLEMQLSSDTRHMITKFAKFSVSIRDSLDAGEVPLDKIIDTVLSLEAFTEGIGVNILDPQDQKEIRAATSVARVFTILRSYISFFNYEIIEHLIQCHGSTEDNKKLEEYLNAFNTFCQRSVFEVPPSVFCNSNQPSGKVFAFKCTEPSRLARLEDVLSVKERIAKIVGLKPLALQLCWIKKGCVELHFLIRAAVSDHIVQIPPSQLSALSKIGVNFLSTEEAHKDYE